MEKNVTSKIFFLSLSYYLLKRINTVRSNGKLFSVFDGNCFSAHNPEGKNDFLLLKKRKKFQQRL